MALPWQRRNNPVEDAPVRRRRNRRRNRLTVEQTQQQNVRINAHLHEERRRQRLAITIGTMLILAIIAIVGVGYYREFFEPPRVTAGEIRDVRFSMGDLVDRIRVLQGINRYQQGGFVDLSVVPFQYLQDMLNAEILRQAAPGLGLSATDEDIDAAIRAQFYPVPQPGEEPDPAQLDRVFDSNYSGFLTQVRLSDSEYRALVEEQILVGQLAGLVMAGVPETPEQVEVEWIRLEFGNAVVPDEVRTRLDTEEFATVASEVGASAGFANGLGYVGWVPQGAFPDLDPVLFGDPENEVEALAVDAISDPLIIQGGIYIIHKISGPEERELSPRMERKLARELVDEWRSEQLTQGSANGWVKINFDSERYAWVADQVRLTAPRVDQPQRPQNPGGLPIGGR